MAQGNSVGSAEVTSFANWDDLQKEFVRDGVERVGFRGEDTLLVMNWLQPGMEPGPHSHPFEQIAVIVSGTVRFHVGDEVYDAGPGSMIRIPPVLADSRFGGVTMLLQVHDELIFEAPEDKTDAVIAAVREVMEGAPAPVVDLSVPLTVDGGAGDSWAEAH